jgi:hypothetical protein
MKIALSIIGGILAVILLVFGLSYVGLIHYQFFAPKYENARRKTFEQTQSYVQGKIQDLSNYKLQYQQAKDTDSKEAIKATIRTQFANFDMTACPDELKPFLQEMRGY